MDNARRVATTLGPAADYRMSADPTLQRALALALERHRAGDLAGAESGFNGVLTLAPHDPIALHHLGILALQRGDPAGAAALLERAVDAAPDDAGAHFNLGLARRSLGRLDAAVESYRRALSINPDFADAHLNLGNLQRLQNHAEPALASYQRALRLNPQHAGTHNNLGSVLQDLGRWAEAATAHRRAIELNPRHAGAHFNLGNALARLRRIDDAIASFQHAATLDPGYRQAHLRAAELLAALRRFAPALAAYERALALQPDDFAALDQVVHIRQLLCAWTGLDDYQARLGAAVDAGFPVRPFTMLSVPSSPAQQQACARRWIADLAGTPSVGRPRSAGGGRLCIGYVSSDYREHPVAYMVAPVFEHHDRRRFRVVAFSLGPALPSPGRQQVVAACDGFTELAGVPDAEAVARIVDVGIDILVDLNGYTGGARPGLFACRPAPIQVNWLGYPGTLGAPFIDYVVVDQAIAAPEDDRWFDEQVVRLPGCYQPNHLDRAVAAIRPTRAALGLPERAIVLCCFNGSYKITQAFFAIWMRLLAAAPDSVLWLLDHDDDTSANLRAAAAAQRIDPARLIFAPSVPVAEHLARQPAADLFLDTLPYGAHTTGRDALWSGVPLLTCRGATFPSRVGASMLGALELPELIASTPADYEARALALLLEPARLQAIRDRLAACRSTAPLFDIARFTRDLETAYERMAARHRAGNRPAPIEIARSDAD